MTNENLLLYAYLGCITTKQALKKSIYQQLEIWGVDFLTHLQEKQGLKSALWSLTSNAARVC